MIVAITNSLFKELIAPRYLSWLSFFIAFMMALISSMSFAEVNAPNPTAGLPEYPIKIQADSTTFNEQQQSMEYLGSVTMQQGPLRIEAEVITILSDESGVTELIASGNPVRYQQTKTDSSPSITAEAHRIHYFKIDERMELTGDAFLDQDGQSFRAPRIEYMLEQQTLRALGSPAGKNKGRVIMVIPPRSTQ